MIAQSWAASPSEKAELEAFQSVLLRHQITEVHLPVDVMHHISMLIVLSYFM